MEILSRNECIGYSKLCACKKCLKRCSEARVVNVLPDLTPVATNPVALENSITVRKIVFKLRHWRIDQDTTVCAWIPKAFDKCMFPEKTWLV